MSTADFPTDPTIDALVARFPRLFHGRHPRVGSDLPQGWTALADQLFADLDAMMDDGAASRFEVLQIKEKFAGLRVYWALGKEQTTVIDLIGAGSVQRIEKSPAKPTALFDRVRARMTRASEQAATTCQRCGNGGASAGGWRVNSRNGSRRGALRFCLGDGKSNRRSIESVRWQRRSPAPRDHGRFVRGQGNSIATYRNHLGVRLAS